MALRQERKQEMFAIAGLLCTLWEIMGGVQRGRDVPRAMFHISTLNQIRTRAVFLHPDAITEGPEIARRLCLDDHEGMKGPGEEGEGNDFFSGRFCNFELSEGQPESKDLAWEGEVCCNYKEGLTKPTQPIEKRESEASLLLTLRFVFNEDPLTSPQPAGVHGGCRCYRFPWDIDALRLQCGSFVIGVNGSARMKHCVPLSEIAICFVWDQ
ncbi:hypothetical protein NQZ68_032983 [Dissostichus eleginoides]|nr:hypothetical protein NQZ68_032983 [Dissostichus eleginoides]